MQLSKSEAVQILKALANYNTDAIEEKVELIDLVAEKLIVSFCEPNND